MTNLEIAIEKIERARLCFDSKHIVNIVIASKYVDSNAIAALYREGQRCFGENKVQDLSTKATELERLPIDWHFIGRIQTNKINKLLDTGVTLIHSVDSYDTAFEIDKRAKEKGIKPRILLQINSAKEDSKAGVMPEVAIEEYQKIQDLENLLLSGVMTIGAHVEDSDAVQKSFETTREIFDNLAHNGAKICSMGMSNDYELAIRCGSNMVRLGSVIFRS